MIVFLNRLSLLFAVKMSRRILRQISSTVDVLEDIPTYGVNSHAVFARFDNSDTAHEGQETSFRTSIRLQLADVRQTASWNENYPELTRRTARRTSPTV